MTMLQKFLEYAQQNRLFCSENNILIAVSGGIDSMAMASLFREAGIMHSLAHCNFSLRGQESDADEEFVRSYAGKHNIPVYSITFDTPGYAYTRGISIQMAARELRYEWFEKMIKENAFDAVAVAHNLNDNVETFFINLLRGTGLNGLTGMKPKNGNIIRPLLFATREEIIKYSEQKEIIFHEDSSNSHIKYTRNRIRHKVLPELEGVTPNSLTAITETINHLCSSATIIDLCIEEIRHRIIKNGSDHVYAEVNEIKQLNPAFLFEIFRKYGLSGRQTDELLSLLESESGKYLNTISHKILKDRKNLVITEIKGEESPDFSFRSIDEMRISGLFNDLHIIEAGTEPLPEEARTACLDLSLLKFPLRVRRWKAGDRFSPLGMNGMKKISDFLIDHKVPVTFKDKVLLLLSGEDIAWVIGYRIDNRFKVTSYTGKILVVSI